MKKRIVSIVCAAMLMLALPTMAWAAASPEKSSSTSTSAVSNGVTAVVDYKYAGDGKLIVEGSQVQASNVPTGSDVIASFHAYTEGKVDIDGNITFVFNVGSQYSGYTAYVYVQHDDGTTEVKTATVSSDGTIAITVDRLSVFSIVLGDKAAGTATAAKASTSSKSPTTGVDMGVVAAGSAIAFVGAAACAVALRKKVTE